MKVSKTKTKLGGLGKPVSVDLDAVVERMRSESVKEAATKIADSARMSRLMMEQGAPRYHLTDVDTLPYLLFSATFTKDGLEHPKTFTHLLLLDINCSKGPAEVAAMKRRVAQVPYTLLAFAGISGVTLKVVVRFGQSKEAADTLADDYLAFLGDAQQSAIRLYEALAGCEVFVREQSFSVGCRMSYDPDLYYNPNATTLPVVRQEHDVLKAYENVEADHRGEVHHTTDADEMEHLRLEYHTCLSKALDEEGDDMERCLQRLADYCAKVQLSEEGCVERTLWQLRFRMFSSDVIRKVFRNAYKKPLKGRTLSMMNEKERIMRSIEDFLSRRYQLRYNVVKQVTEFRPYDITFKAWQPLTDRALKSMVVEEMKEGGESWMNDIRTYVESAHIQDYNPIHEFLASVGTWDGKHDYIEEFAQRLPTSYVHWRRFFHRWFLAMVAQALNLNRDFGNSMVPMLIGAQGIKKSNFCKNILPPALREYYMDDIKMENAEQVERVLGRMWLVCIDEYNAKTEREQAKIKRLLTEKDVQARKMRSDQYTMTPRLCSFIATTNDTTPLPCGDGSRRYLCVEVTGQIDMTEPIPYQQMYAQAVEELHQPDCIYWFTSEDEQEIQRHNQSYQQVSSPELILQSLFEPADQHTKENLWKTTDIQKEIAKQLRACDVPNLKSLGLALKKLNYPKGGISGVRGYYLALRKERGEEML
ncbi:MAG: hypothetical protein IJ633_03425 [Prevotella sp.]|nr:hypothetical protein [Prevotella sp.]